MIYSRLFCGIPETALSQNMYWITTVCQVFFWYAWYMKIGIYKIDESGLCVHIAVGYFAKELAIGFL